MIYDGFNFRSDSSGFPVSIEKFAAYLDGNLSDEEMQRVSSVIEDDEMMQEIVGQSGWIDDWQEAYGQDDDLLPQELEGMDFTIPEVDGLGQDLDTDDEWDIGLGHVDGCWEDETKDMFSNQINIEDMNGKDSTDLQASLAARKIFGEEGFGPEGGLNPVIYQGPEGVCAIRSQQIILRDYGIDIPLETLKEYAIQNGWYDPGEGGGTPMWAIGNLLESCNVHCTQSMDNTVYDLINELAQGHRVIVGVDADELWADRDGDMLKGAQEWLKDIFSGETPNHALIVAGVEVNPNDPDDVKVILTDPGQGDLRIEYELDDFMDAWEDSQCFMVSTDTPAPLQYNPETGMEEPSNFAVKEFIDANSIPLSADNIILPGQMAAMCADAHYSEGHLDTIPVGDHEVDYHKFSSALAKAQEFKSPAAGIVPGLGADHFDKDAFISALKDLFGFGSDESGSETDEIESQGGGHTDGTDEGGHIGGTHDGGDNGGIYGEEVDTDNDDMDMSPEEQL